MNSCSVKAINSKYCEAVIKSYYILIFMIQIQPNALYCIFSFCLVLKGFVDIISIEPPFINPIIQFTTVPVKALTDKVSNYPCFENWLFYCAFSPKGLAHFYFSNKGEFIRINTLQVRKTMLFSTCLILGSVSKVPLWISFFLNKINKIYLNEEFLKPLCFLSSPVRMKIYFSWIIRKIVQIFV